MRVLLTIADVTRVGVVLNIDSGEVGTIPGRVEFIDPLIAERPAFRPFGITWGGGKLFIANNRQLLIFDRDLNFVRRSSTTLQVNTHQLAYNDGRVWAVSPWTNSLIGVCENDKQPALEFGLIDRDLIPYVEREAREEDDRSHFNSLLWTDAHLFVAAHAFGGASFINRYLRGTLQLDHVYYDVGSSVHGLAYDGNELFWISTKTGQLRSDLGYSLSLSLPGYPRGLAVTRRYFVLATSEFLGRGDRHAGDSWIQVIDRRLGKAVTEIRLQNTGSVNDLRLLDEYDFAHRIEPFWRDGLDTVASSTERYGDPG